MNTLLYNGQRVQAQPPHADHGANCGYHAVLPHAPHADQFVVVSHGLVQSQPVQAVWLAHHAHAPSSAAMLHCQSVVAAVQAVQFHPTIQFQPAPQALPTLAIVQVQLIVFLTNILYHAGLRVIQELITRLL